MKRIVTSILGASLLAGVLYAEGDHSSEKGMMNHSNMNEGHMIKCEKFLKASSDENIWTPSKNILLELNSAINNG